MLLDTRLPSAAKPEPRRYFLIRPAFRHHLQHLDLPHRQLRRLPPAPPSAVRRQPRAAPSSPGAVAPRRRPAPASSPVPPPTPPRTLSVELAPQAGYPVLVVLAVHRQARRAQVSRSASAAPNSRAARGRSRLRVRRLCPRTPPAARTPPARDRRPAFVELPTAPSGPPPGGACPRFVALIQRHHGQMDQMLATAQRSPRPRTPARSLPTASPARTSGPRE